MIAHARRIRKKQVLDLLANTGLLQVAAYRLRRDCGTCMVEVDLRAPMAGDTPYIEAADNVLILSATQRDLIVGWVKRATLK